jgi:hypothetical protein
MEYKAHQHLIKIYEKLKTELYKKHKIKKDKWNSVLLSLLEMKSNKRYEILLSAALDKNEITINVDALAKEGYLIKIPHNNSIKYILSAKGIWYIEKEDLSIETFIAYIDEKFFGEYRKETKLSDREKVILWTLISLGAFCEKQAIDLKKDDETKNTIKEAIRECLVLLRSEGCVPRDMCEEALYGKLGNEHPVSHLIRHTDSLPKKTLGVYTVIKPQKYFLNLYDPTTQSFNIEDLVYIYKAIFGEDISLERKNNIMEFIDKIYKRYAIYIFEQRFFTHLDIKKFVDEAIRKAILS